MQQSLWTCLHDASLTALDSDRQHRTITLTLQIEHLRRHAALPAETRWVLQCHDVTRAVATTWVPSPSPSPDTRGLSREQELVAIAEWQAKGRTTSIGWNDFEQVVAHGSVCLSEANLGMRDGAIVLTSCGNHEDGDRFFEFEIVGQRVSCQRTDGTHLEVTALIELGDRYWEAFEQRARRKADE